MPRRRAKPAATTTGNASARVQRLRVAAGPCPRTGPDTASTSAIKSVNTDSAVRTGHGGSSSDASPAPAHARHHRVQPRAAEQPDQQRLAQRAAAQPAHVEGVLALAQQAVLEMQTVGVPPAAPGFRTSPATAAPTAPPTRAPRPRRRRRHWRPRRTAARRHGPTRRVANAQAPHRVPPDTPRRPRRESWPGR